MSRERALFVILAAAVLALVAAAPASAGRRWCEKDPVFEIAGTQVNVAIAIWEEHQWAVTGPIVVTVYVPQDVRAIHIWSDDGYNGFGEVVAIVPTADLGVTNHGVQVRVEVTVPANLTAMPVDVFVSPANGRTKSVNGNANNVVPVQLSVQPSS